MDDVDEEMKKTLESINKEIEENYKNSLNNINQEINRFKTFLCNNKDLIENNRYNIIPKIQLIPEINNPNELINYFINVILFLFSNLEIINELCLGEEYKEILKKLPEKNEQCFTKLFIDLISNMRRKLNGNNYYQPLHNYLKTELKENYLNQNPKFLIRKILIMIENDINKTKNIKNIITDNFCFNLKKLKTCNKCKLNILISEEKKISVDLFLKRADNQKDIKELKSELKNLLLESHDQKLFCPKCNSKMDIFMEIVEPKKYLIFNINKNEKIKNPIKLIYSNNIELTEEKGGKKYNYEYELVSVLADKKIKINDNDIIDINEENKYILFFRNYINSKWYKFVNGKQEDILGNLQVDINNHNPNILIYKKKCLKFGN